MWTTNVDGNVTITLLVQPTWEMAINGFVYSGSS